jgi:hypothetical protein
VKSPRLVFIVNGENMGYDVTDAELDLPTRLYVSLALADSHNTGRYVGDWELRADTGVPLHKEDPIRLIVERGRPVFLTLHCGVGG